MLPLSQAGINRPQNSGQTTPELSKSKVYKNQGNAAVLALVPPRVSKVLDVGCGAGDNAKILKGRSILVDGITHSTLEAQLALQHCRRMYVHDLEDGLPDLQGEMYDCVICSHVIEHIRYPNKLLADISASMNTGGRLIVALPNIMFYKNRAKLLFGRFDYTEAGLMDDTHVRWYTIRTAQELLGKHGFIKEGVFAEGWFPLYVLRRLLPATTVRSIDDLACRVLPGLFGYQLLLVYTKPLAESS